VDLNLREGVLIMATWKNEIDPPNTIIVYDVDGKKELNPGDTAVIYRDVTASGLTKLLDTPYYTPIHDAQNALSFTGVETKTITPTPRITRNVLIHHISTGYLTVHFNDISTDGITVQTGERLNIPVDDYITSLILVSSATLTCDVVQLRAGEIQYS
jgi:hypothetical protein